jgi:hypothetical protein
MLPVVACERLSVESGVKLLQLSVAEYVLLMPSIPGLMPSKDLEYIALAKKRVEGEYL